MRRTNICFAAAIIWGTAATSIAAQTNPPTQRQPAATARLDHRELTADQQIIQALNRLTFGPRPGDAQKVRAMGLDKWVGLQLHPERIDNTTFEQFASRYDILKRDQNDLLRQFAEVQRERRMVRRDRADSAQ